MVDVKRIFEDYQPELKRVEEYLFKTISTESAFIGMIGRHIVKSGGKRMRPLFLILAAKLAGYEGTEHIRLSSVIESPSLLYR